MADPDTERFKVWPTLLDQQHFKDVISSESPEALQQIYPLVRKCQSKHMVDRLNPRPAWLCRRLTSKFSGAQSSFLRPGGNYCRFARYSG